MRVSEIVYLGPEGTYAHEVSKKRFRHAKVKLTGCDTVLDVCRYVARHPKSRGVVPSLNSSGGTIYETVDALLDDTLSLRVEEELTLDVKLALLGRRGEEPSAIYSHFVPLRHCRDWLRREFPKAEIIKAASTAAAAREAACRSNAVAIGGRWAASIYGIDVLEYPIAGMAGENVTHFFVVGKKVQPLPRVQKTSLGVYLPNTPGSLCSFLLPLSGLNLSRLVSRPIPGRPRAFSFFIDVDADARKPVLRNALAASRKTGAEIRILGSYPSHRMYHS